MAALVHVNGAEAEAKDVILGSLAGALSVALTVNQLLISATFGLIGAAWSNASAIVVDEVVGADRGANVALSDDEGRRALRVPLVLTLLAVMALLVLAIASPEGKRLLAAKLGLFKELRAGVFAISSWHLVVKGALFDFIVSSRASRSALVTTSWLSWGSLPFLRRLLLLKTTLVPGTTLLLLAVSTTLASTVSASAGRGSMSVMCQGLFVHRWRGVSTMARSWALVVLCRGHWMTTVRAGMHRCSCMGTSGSV